MNSYKSLLLIGPNFHHFNQSVQRAFEQLGWNVALCAYDTPITHYSLSNKIRYKLSRNKELLKNNSRISFSKQVKVTFCTLNPQLVFLLNGEMLSSEVVEYMQKQCPVIIWLYDSITRLPQCWNILPYCSNVFCYEQEDIPLIREKLSIECGFIPQAEDPVLYYSIDNPNKKWDVVFAADIWQSTKRKQYIQKVVSTFPTCKIKVWGRYKPWYKGFWEWLTRERRDIYANCNTSSQQLNEDYNLSKVVLNVHHEQQKNGANPKVFEISGSGAYQVCDANPYIESLFSNGEVGLYHNEEEMIEQIRWALDPANEQERERRAKAAQEIILKDNTFLSRVKQMLEVAEIN